MPSEEECAFVLRGIRRDGVSCSKCGSANVVRHGRHLEVYRRYLSYGCKRHFNDRTGTQFEDSKLFIQVRLFAAFLMQYKVSVMEIAKTARISYPTASSLAKTLRRGLYLSQLQERMRSIVELDEVYVTAGLKGKHSPFNSTASNTVSSEKRGGRQCQKARGHRISPLANMEKESCQISTKISCVENFIEIQALFSIIKLHRAYMRNETR